MRVDINYGQSLARPEPASLYKKPRSLMSARYGTDGSSELADAGRPPPRLRCWRPNALAPPSSHRLADHQDGMWRQDWVRVPILIFRKIHLYANLTKTTHDHQTTKPIFAFLSDLVKIGPTTTTASQKRAAHRARDRAPKRATHLSHSCEEVRRGRR